ncbi:MAG TPA: HEAT repeat domain-containing protein [Gemmatimonadales bacterium]|nr:HEAT repeat domain-containing protein [Gemmatimonadales bacterium]
MLIASLRPPSPALAQALPDRITAGGDGRVRMSFPAKPGVCGNGKNISTSRTSRDWESWCEAGPVRVVLTVQQRQVVEVDTYVGGRWRAGGTEVRDLGEVSPARAAEYFLSLVAAAPGPVAKAAVLPAVLADSLEVWPGLLRIARDDTRPREVRKAAVFWVGQAAEEAAEGLAQMVAQGGDTEVREHAVFALSQLPRHQGVPMLLEIARTHPEARVRKKAIFWLGQSDDPRALALFEELLVRR